MASEIQPLPDARHRGSIAVHAPTLALFLAASAAPSPLYRLYQQHWGFSPLVLTIVFAAYSIALLSALLLTGGISDHLGRRPVILAAIAGEIAAMSGLLFARDATWLVAARLLQGLATGLAVSAIGAAILDADRDRGPLLNAVVPMLGMGAGGLGAGVLVVAAPAPTHLIYLVLIALLIVQALATWRTVETVPAPTGHLRIRPRIAVPPHARATLLVASPAAVALWMLGGFSLSMLPSLLARTLPGSGSLLGGLSVAVLTVTAAAAILMVRRHPPERALPLGAALLIIGVVTLLAGAHAASLPLLLAGAAVAGLGFGAGWFGALRSVLPLALPSERAALMSAFYVECYLANSLPVIVAGLAVPRIGLLATTDRYGAAIVLLAVLALAASALRRAGRSAPNPSWNEPPRPETATPR